MYAEPQSHLSQYLIVEFTFATILVKQAGNLASALETAFKQVQRLIEVTF